MPHHLREQSAPPKRWGNGNDSHCRHRHLTARDCHRAAEGATGGDPALPNFEAEVTVELDDLLFVLPLLGHVVGVEAPHDGGEEGVEVTLGCVRQLRPGKVWRLWLVGIGTVNSAELGRANWLSHWPRNSGRTATRGSDLRRTATTSGETVRSPVPRPAAVGPEGGASQFPAAVPRASCSGPPGEDRPR